MGGGDLNLKKSWHPLLIKNQERVWKEERKALDERKQTQQLLKEQAEERQIQELQRLGGKVEQRVEWLYNAPASGSGQNTEELEAYLLGKKSVEQLFNEQDRQKMAELQQASSSAIATGANAAATPASFQALGAQANNVRDLAAKVKLDPLLAIKQQEQRAYEELMKDPKRLKALREARDAAKGEKKKDKKEKKHKRHLDDYERRDDDRDKRRRSRYSDDDDLDRRYSDRHRSGSSRRPRSPSPPPRRRERTRSRSPPRRRDRSPSPYSRRTEDSRTSRRSPPRYEKRNGPSFSNGHTNGRKSYGEQNGSSRLAPARAGGIPDAEARLAAMQASAAQLSSARDKRLAEQAVVDRANDEREAAQRERKFVKGGGNIEPQFLKQQQKQMLDRKLEGSNSVRYGQRADDGQDE